MMKIHEHYERGCGGTACGNTTIVVKGLILVSL